MAVQWDTGEFFVCILVTGTELGPSSSRYKVQTQSAAGLLPLATSHWLPDSQTKIKSIFNLHWERSARGIDFISF